MKKSHEKLLKAMVLSFEKEQKETINLIKETREHIQRITISIDAFLKQLDDN
tara:strand:+ start:453 stop:608 length:156 start_codon:yes stop_codon:yes gene_type:complete